MQFLKFEIINKGTQPWTRTYISFVSDPDLGDGQMMIILDVIQPVN